MEKAMVDDDTVEQLCGLDKEVIAAAGKVRFFNRPVVGGKGSELYTPEGSALIDFSSTWTVAGLGYGDPRIAENVHKTLLNCPGLGIGSLINAPCLELAKRLLELTDTVGYGKKECERRVYLGHSGSDANDIAMRLCRAASERKGGGRRVLAFEHSYHGGFGEALGLSGVQVEGGAREDQCVTFLPYPNRTNPHVSSGNIEDELDFCLKEARRAALGNDVACLIVEPILSDGGMIVPPDGFLSGLRSICDEFDIPMICDEVKVGLGRPGTTHAYQHEGIQPDIVTFGKTLGAGLPISAIVGPASIMDCAPGSALLTMGGNPVCASAALSFLDILQGEDLARRAGEKGDYLEKRLRRILSKREGRISRHVVDVRGRGLARAMELDDGKSPERFAEKVCYRANQLGVVVYYVGGHVLELTPALTISYEQLDDGADIIVQAIEDVANGAIDDDEICGFGGW